MNKTITSNEQFSKTYIPFIKACKKAGVEPTPRQASKYRRGIGKVIEFSSEKWRIKAYEGN